MGHIPSVTATTDIPILTFEQAMEHHADSAEFDRSRWLYIPDFYSEYRYILGTVGNRPLITIGINPSTAAPDNLDNTLKSVERIAKSNGFDSFIMFNVYAQRATDPKQMEKTVNPALHAENMRAFRWVLERSGDEPTVWAAWGAVVERRTYLKDCLRDMLDIGRSYNVRWVCAGECSRSGGHPHHPLYLRKDSKLRPFDLDTYLATNTEKTQG